VGSTEPVRNELVGESHRYREATGSNQVEAPNPSGLHTHNCTNCVHNCDDHSLLNLNSVEVNQVNNLFLDLLPT